MCYEEQVILKPHKTGIEHTGTICDVEVLSQQYQHQLFLYCNNYIAHKLYIQVYKLKISSQSSDRRYFLLRVAEWHWNVAVKFLTCLWASQNTVEPVGLLLWGLSKCHCYFHWVWPSCVSYFHWVWPSCVSMFLLHPCRDRTWQYRVCYIRDGKSLHVHTL